MFAVDNRTDTDDDCIQQYPATKVSYAIYGKEMVASGTHLLKVGFGNTCVPPQHGASCTLFTRV